MAEGQERAQSPGKGRRWLGRAVLLAILVAVGAIVVPNLRRAYRTPGEESTGGTLRTMNSALMTYMSTYNNGFPASLEWLAPNPEGEDNCDRAGMLDPALAVASPQKQGYNYFYRPAGERLSEPGPGCAIPGVQSYVLTARPLYYEKTGIKSYYTDETGVMRVTYEDRAATAADPPLQ